MITKVDVVICTRNPSEIRPELIFVLKSALWVNSIIIETSKPLSVARKNGLAKATTEWVAMFDDDIDLPPNWYPRIVEGFCLDPKVVAISSIYTETNLHMNAYLKAASLFTPPGRPVSYICNTLIRRHALDGYDPPSCFECEDDILMSSLKGQWLTQGNIGVVHHLKWKNCSGIGKSFRLYGFWNKKKIAYSIMSRFFVALVASFYSRTPKTIYLHWKKNFEIIRGYLAP